MWINVECALAAMRLWIRVVVCVTRSLASPFLDLIGPHVCAVCNGNESARDVCGVCNGNNVNRDDCGVCYGTNKHKDQCGVCNGDHTTCLGCDGVPNGLVLDQCGVCGGSNTCRQVAARQPIFALCKLKRGNANAGQSTVAT